MAIECLGYTIIRSDRLADWDSFLCQVVGAMKGSTTAASADYRIDNRPFRFRIIDAAGAGDRLVAAGYRMDSRASLDALAGRLADAGCATRWGDENEARSRGVDAFFATSDPSDNGFEFYCGDSTTDVPFVSPLGVSSFVTGDLGMGHAVLGVRDFEASIEFFSDIMGFHLTDLPIYKMFGPDGPDMPMAFMHADNGRHHSLAFGQTPPIPSACIHLMVEMADPKDVEACHERMARFGIEESASMGKHTNDDVVSFYMKSPSGFDIEVGSGGLVIDPATWQTTALHEPSLWGHDWAFIKAAKAAMAGG